MLLLSRFSRVRLCETPQTTVHQDPPSLGFSRQEHWSGLPFPSPMHENENESEVAQSCPTLCDPMNCSLPGFSIHGIFQAGVLEWVVISFSIIQLSKGLSILLISSKNFQFCWYFLKNFSVLIFIYFYSSLIYYFLPSANLGFVCSSPSSLRCKVRLLTPDLFCFNVGRNLLLKPSFLILLLLHP